VQSVNGDIQDSASDFFCDFFAGENCAKNKLIIGA